MDLPPVHANAFSLAGLHHLPDFAGDDEDAATWLDRIEEAADICGWDQARRLQVARYLLTGNARAWEMGVRNELDTWVAFKNAFSECFALNRDQLFQRLTNCQRKVNETVRAYSIRYRSLCSQLNINATTDDEHISQYLEGLNDDGLYNAVVVLDPDTLATAMRRACHLAEKMRGLDRKADGLDIRHTKDSDMRIHRYPNQQQTQFRPQPRFTDRPSRPMEHSRPQNGQRDVRFRDDRDQRPDPNRFRPSGPPQAAAPPASSNTPSVEELSRSLARLTLAMQQAGIDTMQPKHVHTYEYADSGSNSRSAWDDDYAPRRNHTHSSDRVHLYDHVDTYDDEDDDACYYQHSGIYAGGVKRVGEFDPSQPLPSKRVAVTPDSRMPAQCHHTTVHVKRTPAILCRHSTELHPLHYNPQKSLTHRQAFVVLIGLHATPATLRSAPPLCPLSQQMRSGS